jgi:dTDP-4-dehydrorhamnose 3,5-epimerase
MPTHVEPTAIADVKLITPALVRDERGFFVETYNRAALAGAGIAAEFVQDNLSFSRPRGTLRGLHFQLPPHAQGKLVRVARGSIFDVALDIRTGAPTFGRHVGATLTAESGAQLWIPPGFAHAFCTLEDDTEVCYKVTDYYYPDLDRGIAFDDPELAIRWPFTPAAMTLSARDRRHPRLRELASPFVWAR